MVGQLAEGHELVEHGLHPDQLTHRARVLPGHAHGPGEWREGAPQQPLQREPRRADQRAHPPNAGVEHGEQPQKSHEHGSHLDGEKRSLHGPAPCRVDDVDVGRVLRLYAERGGGFGGFGFGIQQLGHHQRRRGRHDGGRHEVPADGGEVRREQAHVRHEEAAADGGQAGHHEGKDLGARHALQVGAHQQWRFHEPQEDAARRGECFGARGAHGALHDPRHAVHHALHEAQVVEHRHECREEDDGGEDVKGEVGPGARGLCGAGGDGGVAAGGAGAHRDVVEHQVAEEELGPGIGEAHDAQQCLVDRAKEAAGARREQHEGAKEQLQGEAPPDQSPGDGVAVAAQCPADAHEDGQAGERAQLRWEHQVRQPVITRLSTGFWCG